MADEHRKIEPRLPVAGTGMASDPERIEDLQHNYERRVRASLPRQGPGFGAVLEQAPAFDPDADPSASEENDETGDGTSGDGASGDEASDENGKSPASPLPKTPPDPRMRALHAAFGGHLAPASVPKGVPDVEPSAVAKRTPPASEPRPQPRAKDRSQQTSDRVEAVPSSTAARPAKRLRSKGGRAPK